MAKLEDKPKLLVFLVIIIAAVVLCIFGFIMGIIFVVLDISSPLLRSVLVSASLFGIGIIVYQRKKINSKIY